MIKLRNTSVRFDQATHTYTTEDGVILSGVTAMLSKMLFADKYSGVPESVMERAKQRGSYIHECCELADTLHVNTHCEEAESYVKLRAKMGLSHLASEFLISDEENIASSIDAVLVPEEQPDMVDLVDFKTTYKLDKEYVGWQLSVYAPIFERQTGVKVRKLWAVWLRNGKAEFVEVERKPDETIKKLVQCYVSGWPFKDASIVPRKVSGLPDKYAEVEAFIEDIDVQYRYWKEKRSELMEGVMKEMVKSGDYKWEGDNVVFIRKKDTIRKSFDAASFKEDYPELYEQYVKESPVVGSVTMKLKEEPKNTD